MKYFALKEKLGKRLMREGLAPMQALIITKLVDFLPIHVRQNPLHPFWNAKRTIKILGNIDNILDSSLLQHCLKKMNTLLELTAEEQKVLEEKKNKKKDLPSNKTIYHQLKLYYETYGVLPDTKSVKIFAPENFSWSNLQLRLKNEKNLTFLEIIQIYDPNFRPKKEPSKRTIYEHLRIYRSRKGKLPKQHGNEHCIEGWNWRQLSYYCRIKGTTFGKIYKEFDSSYREKTKPFPDEIVVFLHMYKVFKNTGRIPSYNAEKSTAPKGWSWSGIYSRIETDQNLTHHEFFKKYMPNYVKAYPKNLKPFLSDEKIFEHMNRVFIDTGSIPPINAKGETAPEGWSWSGIYRRIKVEQGLTHHEFFKKHKPDYHIPSRARTKYDKEQLNFSKPTNDVDSNDPKEDFETSVNTTQKPHFEQPLTVRPVEPGDHLLPRYG